MSGLWAWLSQDGMTTVDRWQVGAAVAQIAMAVVAVAALIVTVLVARNTLKKTEELSDRDRASLEQIEQATEARAQRSENAAALTIDALDRIASILERQPAVMGPGVAPGKVSWRLIHSRAARYCLENTGDATAYSVEVSGHDTLIGPKAIEGGPDLEAGEALTFTAMRAMQTTDSTITVTWQAAPGDDQERLQWRYPLPSKG